MHWIDGGHRFDQAGFSIHAFTRLSYTNPVYGLYVDEDSPPHQLHALIQRVRAEVALTQASMIVVDGMLAMFLDEQIKRFEHVPFYAIA